jgi:hypothetical protein
MRLVDSRPAASGPSNGCAAGNRAWRRRTEFETGRGFERQGDLVELGGFEPPTSWVRSAPPTRSSQPSRQDGTWNPLANGNRSPPGPPHPSSAGSSEAASNRGDVRRGGYRPPDHRHWSKGAAGRSPAKRRRDAARAALSSSPLGGIRLVRRPPKTRRRVTSTLFSVIQGEAAAQPRALARSSAW